VSCSSCEQRFEAYLDDTLLPVQRAQVITHVNACGRCRGVLDELRVVDALLAAPRSVELPENFTFVTMAEVRSVPRPHVSHAPTFAYLVSYLVAAWLLIGAGFLLAPNVMRAFGETALDLSGPVARMIGSFARAGLRVAADFGLLGPAGGAAIFVAAAAVVTAIVALALLRPRLAERLRS
jgi:anti-sigma factor RsiW